MRAVVRVVGVEVEVELFRAKALQPKGCYFLARSFY